MFFSIFLLDTLGIRYSLVCSEGKYPLTETTPQDLSYLDVANGDLVVPATADPRPSYCLETFKDKCSLKNVKNYRFVCFPPTTDIVKMKHKLQKFSIVSI